MKKWICVLLLCLIAHQLPAEDGYRLWLRYDKIGKADILRSYQHIHTICIPGNSEVLISARAELQRGLEGLLGRTIKVTDKPVPGALIVAPVIGTSGATPATTGTGSGSKTTFAPASNTHYTSGATGYAYGTPNRTDTVLSAIIRAEVSDKMLREAGAEGFVIRTTTRNNQPYMVITANSDAGVLYGVFHLLRMIQTYQSIQSLGIVSAPSIQHRVLNHWDNLNRTVERGYAGFSLWDWQRLPDYIDPRYIDYARANASIGINGTVLTNVNANARIITPEYLVKVAALANVFRRYGIKVYLTARFSAPIENGGLPTADPLDPKVQDWWKRTIDTIYSFIPDFGGFLVKANSEGQPGPQNYGRNHADGANMLADALAPHHGIVMWRAFVYNPDNKDDRYKQAYQEFKPLDGQFRKNVIVQVKNGPIDFQPREPFHPLFGAMPATPLMMEFQITQEYLGFAAHLVFLAPLFKECLTSDTYAKGKGSAVASVIDGSLNKHTLTGMAGVANIGNDINWCGHPFAQANWYAFGRLAWNHQLNTESVAREWIQQTFSNENAFIQPVLQFMMASRENTVHYMTPLGLHHIMGNSHHYGPAPWSNHAPRADWDPVYYHKASADSIGFDRTATGSNALAQYEPEVRKQFEKLADCPEEYLLWFHRVDWKHQMRSGKTLWNELCAQYNAGVEGVRSMQRTWNGLSKYVDAERFVQVQQLMTIQEKEAVWWRNACLLYFQTFSKMPIPGHIEQPDHTLEYYQQLRFPFAPGI